jgi:hypothetical protein
VYQAALRESHLTAQTSTLMINQATTDKDLADYARTRRLRSDSSWLPADAIDRFLDAAVEPSHHRRFDNLGLSYAVVTDTEQASLRRGGGIDMDLFFQRYPQTLGLVTLSRVTFSADHQWALVYVSLVNGSFGGFGRLYIFDRDGASWHLAAGRDVWVS